MAIIGGYPSNLSPNTYFSGRVKALADQRRARAGAQDGRVVGLPRKNLANPLCKMFNRQGVIVRIKAVLVPAFAEGCTVVKIDMAAIGFALVSVAAHVM